MMSMSMCDVSQIASSVPVSVPPRHKCRSSPPQDGHDSYSRHAYGRAHHTKHAKRAHTHTHTHTHTTHTHTRQTHTHTHAHINTQQTHTTHTHTHTHTHTCNTQHHVSGETQHTTRTHTTHSKHTVWLPLSYVCLMRTLHVSCCVLSIRPAVLIASPCLIASCLNQGRDMSHMRYLITSHEVVRVIIPHAPACACCTEQRGVQTLSFANMLTVTQLIPYVSCEEPIETGDTTTCAMGVSGMSAHMHRDVWICVCVCVCVCVCMCCVSVRPRCRDDTAWTNEYETPVCGGG